MSQFIESLNVWQANIASLQTHDTSKLPEMATGEFKKYDLVA
jgi:hypothetical protein